MNDDLSNWILRDSPRGEDLPITCTYPYSRGKATPDAGDLPAGWQIVPFSSEDPDGILAGAGFSPMASYLNVMEDGTTVLTGEPTEHVISWLYLLDPDLRIVATWDEGRWWTPDEQAAWNLMLRVPSTYVVAEGFAEQDLPRWMRRKKRRS